MSAEVQGLESFWAWGGSHCSWAAPGSPTLPGSQASSQVSERRKVRLGWDVCPKGSLAERVRAGGGGSWADSAPLHPLLQTHGQSSLWKCQVLLLVGKERCEIPFGCPSPSPSRKVGCLHQAHQMPAVSVPFYSPSRLKKPLHIQLPQLGAFSGGTFLTPHFTDENIESGSDSLWQSWN